MGVEEETEICECSEVGICSEEALECEEAQRDDLKQCFRRDYWRVLNHSFRTFGCVWLVLQCIVSIV
jgi:hypothetical protein